MPCRDYPYPLLRGGTSQADRALPALAPDYVLADEKTTAARIEYAAQLSAYVRLFDATNNVQGDWQGFFTGDVAAALAFVVVQDPDAWKPAADLLKELQGNPSPGDIPKLAGEFTTLFAMALTFAQAMDGLLNRLPDGYPFTVFVTNTITQKLAPVSSRCWPTTWRPRPPPPCWTNRLCRNFPCLGRPCRSLPQSPPAD